MRDKAVLLTGCLIILYFVFSMIFYWGYNLAILALGLVMAVLSMEELRERAVRLFKKLGKPVQTAVLSLLILFLASFFLVEGLIISYAVRGGQAEKSDYLMILGASIRGKELSRSLKARLDKGLEYLERYPDTKVIVSGGKGMGESITEAEAMRRYLVGKGVAPDTIIMEEKSTSTYENFLFTRVVLGHAAISGKTSFTVVTNDFHMFRSRLLAKRQGLEIYTLPCRTAWYLVPNCYAREYFAVIKSLVFDR